MQTMDEIGWTRMHLKLFFLNGFGYAADSLILALQAVTATQAALEFRPSFAYGLNVSVYTGMLVGVLFWGLGSTGTVHWYRSKPFTELLFLTRCGRHRTPFCFQRLPLLLLDFCHCCWGITQLDCACYICWSSSVSHLLCLDPPGAMIL